jgi:ADP-ribosylglycohydrolase/8-oxo-dGTP pyrophosphatase MutT (NUDIX family)
MTAKKTTSKKTPEDIMSDAFWREVRMPLPGEVEQFGRDLRIMGCLVGMACGDALGVPYEGNHQGPPPGQARMTGGGYGSYRPGQWSDDTECAVMVARGKGDRLTIAANLMAWYRSSPPDIGPTSRAVLSRAKDPRDMARLAREVTRGKVPGEISNGSLMRTAPVALAHLGYPERIADAARQVSDLTHCDFYAGDACVLWCLAIAQAVELGEAFRPTMVADGLPFIPEARRETWASLIAETLASPDGRGLRLRHNWSAVGAFRAALWAVAHARTYKATVDLACSFGSDTDTVSSIAGALAGSIHGLMAVPSAWYRKCTGWPNDMNAVDLAALALKCAGRGRVVRPDPEADVAANRHPCPASIQGHWGPRGAAGLVPVAEVGGQRYVLLAHRSPAVDQGMCWSTPGGAIEPAETALAAAFRECREEIAGLPRRGQVIAEADTPCGHGCGWSYKTFAVLLDFDAARLPKVSIREAHAWETDAVKWVPVADVAELDLHPAFAAKWPELAQAVTVA